MLPTERRSTEVYQIIEQGELFGRDAGQVACHIHAAVEGIVVHFQEIAGIHIGGTLPPVVVNFQGRVGDAVKAEEEKNRNEIFYIGNVLQSFFWGKVNQFAKQSAFKP